MISVLFVVPRFHPNLWFATKALVESGARVAVWVSDTAPEVEDHSIVAPRVFADPSDAAGLKAAFAGFAPDLVFLRNTSDLKHAVARAARGTKAQLWSYDQHPLDRPRSFWKRLRLRLDGLPARRVTPVPGLTDTPPDPQSRYLPWPVCTGLPEMPERPDAPVTVLCVGKLAQPRKNQPLVIDALRQAGRAGRARLILAGATSHTISGADADHMAVLEAAAREDWCEIHRDVAFRDMPALYARSHVCILPSTAEPLGTAPVEAMAWGCVPVISTSAGSAGYLVDGGDGLLLDLSQPDRIETALGALIDDPALRARLAAGARETAGDDLGPKRFLARIRDLLREG